MVTYTRPRLTMDNFPFPLRAVLENAALMSPEDRNYPYARSATDFVTRAGIISLVKPGPSKGKGRTYTVDGKFVDELLGLAHRFVARERTAEVNRAKAAQEGATRIEKLERRIDALEAEVKRLRNGITLDLPTIETSGHTKETFQNG